MKYMTGYVYADCTVSGSNEESLCLVQVCYGRTEVVLACVCDGGAVGSSVTKQLKLWLAERGSALFGRKVSMRQVLEELEKVCERLQKEARSALQKTANTQKLNLAGVLIAGQECVLIQNGDGCICLLNRKFGRSHRQFLKLQQENKKEWSLNVAQIERKVGILIGREAFLKEIDRETMLQCLAVREITKEAQLERRLRELTEESRRQGYQRECSAVLIQSAI